MRKALYGLKNWQKQAVLMLVVFAVIGCSNIRYLPVQNREVINYVDSTRIRDSIVIVPIERFVDIVPELDTLKMETSLATAVAYCDTSLRMLRGTITNKQQIQYKYKTVEKLVEVTDTVYVERPVEVEVEKTVTPKWAWYNLAFSILIILGFILRLYLKKFV